MSSNTSWLPHAALAFLLTAGAPTRAAADLLLVPSEYATIQAGIDAASSGDTVRVADGTYTGPGNRDLDYGGTDLVLESENGSDLTIIDCQGAGRGAIFAATESSAAVLDGFTITGGAATQGGGLLIQSAPTIKNCKITGNTATAGAESFGGGIFCSGNPIILDCELTGNSVDLDEGQGGGLFVQPLTSGPTVIGTTISGNSASNGGGVTSIGATSPLVAWFPGCVVTGNRGHTGTGGVANLAGPVTLTRCTIAGNRGATAGGLSNGGLDPMVIERSILWGNCADTGGGYEGSGDVEVTCCVVNDTGITGTFTSDVTTIEWDPLFCDPEACANAPTTAGDYALSTLSLARPENSRCAQLIGGVEEVCADEFDAEAVGLLGRVPLSEFGPSVDYPTRLAFNDVWGYVSPSGREYALIGLYLGTGFVEVTDPQNPTVVEVMDDSASIWSDMAVYDHYAYNVNEWFPGHGIQIFDLDAIDGGTVVLAATYTSGLLTAHNIAVNETSGFAYPVGSNLAQGGLVALDLSNPISPAFAGQWDSLYVHDVVVVTYDSGPYAGRELAFAACGGHGLVVVDVTNKLNMTTLSLMTYPTVDYCHQAWLSEDKSTLFINDELDERDGLVATTTTYVFDVQDPGSPSFVTTFTNGVEATDHNLMVRGQHVFEANYASGLRVFDAVDLMNINEVGHFDTFPEYDNTGFDGLWGVYTQLPSGSILASDRSRGLFVLEFPAVTDVASATPAQLAAYRLHPNVPNPFNPATRLGYELPEPATVILKIHDAGGRLVRTLIPSGDLAAGRHEIVWNGRDSVGRQAPTGVYFVSLVAGSLRDSRSIVLVR